MQRASLFCIGCLAVIVLMSTQSIAAQNKDFSIGTSTMGGSMQIMASPLAKIITEKVPNTSASVQNTPGPQANLQFMEADEMYMAFCSTPVAYDALMGTGWTKGRKYEKFRTMLVMYPSYFQFVTTEGTGIKNIRDLTGKRVHTSIPGTTPDIVIQSIVKVLDLAFKEKHPLNPGPATDMLRDGRVDAVSCAMGIPTPFIMDLQATTSSRLVQMSAEDQNLVAVKNPYLAKIQIPANTYKQQPDPINTFALWNFVVVHKDLPNDLVYQMTKAAHEGHEEFAAAAAIGKDFRAENILHTVGLIHPGAVQYYQELGIVIPENMIAK